MNLPKSKALFEEAQRLIPGGVNSPVRAFKSVGGNPFFVERASGPYLYDVEGNRYIDYVGSWGPLILGHAPPRIVAAVKEAVERGTSYGAPTSLEVELARLIVNAVPSIERVRMVNSGTEAVMTAIRLARGYTKRDKVLKFEGCYHGHADGLLSKAGSGLATMGIPESPGVPESFARDTITATYNDLDGVREIVSALGNELASVIVEPVAGNCGVIPPKPGFLEGLRELTEERGIVLIFDEVITGFRVAYGGAQERFGVMPDLTTLGKIIGGGFPVGAYGGKAEIMDLIAPVGPVYQAGTLSGNPIAMTAGIETLKILAEPGAYDNLERKSASLADGFTEAACGAGVSATLNRVGSMMCAFFTDRPVLNYDDASTSGTNLYSAFFHAMLEAGVYFAPSRMEAAFVSLAHSDEDLSATVAAAERALRSVKRKA